MVRDSDWRLNVAKFVINKDFGDPLVFEADSYDQKDDYFHFYSEELGRVGSVSAKLVTTIDRENK